MQNTSKRCVILLVYIILRWSFNYESNVYRYNKILIDCIREYQVLLLFPHTHSISIYYCSVYEHHYKIFYIKIAIFLLFHCLTIERSIVFKTMDRQCESNLTINIGFASVNSQYLGYNKLAIPSYPVNKYILLYLSIWTSQQISLH